MLPNSILNRFKNPAQMETDFLKYLTAAGARIDNSKTIASVSYYHQIALGGLTSANYFTGELITGNTNLPTFIRPQTEHVVIYAIKAWQGDSDVEVFESQWISGVAEPTLQNSVYTITNNSEVELKNYPMVDFHNDLTTKDQGTIFLDEPIIWLGQTELKLALQAPPGLTFDIAVPIRFELIGLGLI